MKKCALLWLSVFVTSFATAQYKIVEKCIIENGTLKNVPAEYDGATGNYFVTVAGEKKNFNVVYPDNTKDYAKSTTWFVNTDTIDVNGTRYSRYGFPRILRVTDITKNTSYKQLGVYVEAGTKTAEVIYIPSQRGCEFQPYLKVPVAVSTQKIYYDENWQVTTAGNAAYYRLVSLDASNKPVGLVMDFFITGEKQWQGRLSHIDLKDNTKDVSEGIVTWFHKNGKKAAEVKKQNGREEGIYKSWNESGLPESEVEYQYGMLNGASKTWYPNGKPQAIEFFASNQLHGKQIYYLEDGRVSYEEQYEMGKPVNPCYNRLDLDGHEYEVCTEVFSRPKQIFNWNYAGKAATAHSMDMNGLVLNAGANVKSVAFFDLGTDTKDLESISTDFFVDSENKDAEYGLVWNFADTANFNYFIMSRGGWWSAGSFRNGKRFGLERDGITKMSREEFWNPNDDKQRISISRSLGGMALSLNGNQIYSTTNAIEFKQRNAGIIVLNDARVYFERFTRSFRKNSPSPTP
jgi:antitoxin component YwqK of YwqJK toxin-antitoxin module